MVEGGGGRHLQRPWHRRFLQPLVLPFWLGAFAVAAPPEASGDDICEADGSGRCGSGGGESGESGEYFWPHGRGLPRHFGQSPYSFGGGLCNSSVKLRWSWHHPAGKYQSMILSKPIIDDGRNIFITSLDGIRKFSQDGEVLWFWEVDESFKSRASYVPNNLAIMNGALYACMTSGEVFALSMDTGRMLWMVTPGSRGIGSDTSFVTALDGKVFVDIDTPWPMVNITNKVVALDGSSGSTLWEYTPDQGVWNFLPLFPEDGTMVFQDWSAGVHQVNLTNGEPKLVVPAKDRTSWTDGGAGLGPNGVIYAVSSENHQLDSWQSTGGGIHAYRLSDGKLLWENTSFDQGIYTYPIVGRLGSGPELTVVTGVGSLGSVPYAFQVLHVAPLPCKAGLALGVVVWLVLACRSSRSRARKVCCLLALPLLGFLAALMLSLALVSALGKRRYPSSVHAFDAETGAPKWSVDLPTWHGFAPAGDSEGLWERLQAGYGHRPICLPCASSYPTLDADGVLFFGHLDGRLYSIKDLNEDGQIDPGTELCSFDGGGAFFTGGPSIAPGMLAVSSCDTLFVFGDEKR